MGWQVQWKITINSKKKFDEKYNSSKMGFLKCNFMVTKLVELIDMQIPIAHDSM
jgi:hypothetical protein